MSRRKREDLAAANGEAFGKQIAGGDCSEDTAKTTFRQPLVIDRGGLVRFASLAELRRLARLGTWGRA